MENKAALNFDNAAILVQPKDMLTQLVSPKDGKHFQLDELYELLDCEMIQVVPLNTPGAYLVLDEEGRIRFDQGHNPNGYFHFGLFGNEILCGRGLIIGQKNGEIIGTKLTIRDVAHLITWMPSD